MFDFLKPYPVKVIIFKRRGTESPSIAFDEACREKRKDKTESYKLKKEKKEIPPPQFEYLYTGKKGKTILFLYSPEDGQYAPMKIENPNLKVADKEMENWLQMEVRRTYEKYKPKESLLFKLLPLIGVMILFAALIITYILFGKTMESVASSAASAAQSAAEAAKTIKGIPPM
jgi:hypothetical protein